MPGNCFINFDGIDGAGLTDTLVFEQSQTRHGNGQQGPTGDLSVVGEVSTGGTFSPDGRQLVVSIKDGPVADDVIETLLSLVYNNPALDPEPSFLPAIQQDYDLS
jgi:hypothetical protein